MNKKLHFMTRREYASIIKPSSIGDRYLGGVEGCPEDYDLNNPFTCNPEKNYCRMCWDKPARRNGRYIAVIMDGENNA